MIAGVLAADLQIGGHKLLLFAEEVHEGKINSCRVCAEKSLRATAKLWAWREIKHRRCRGACLCITVHPAARGLTPSSINFNCIITDQRAGQKYLSLTLPVSRASVRVADLTGLILVGLTAIRHLMCQIASECYSALYTHVCIGNTEPFVATLLLPLPQR